MLNLSYEIRERVAPEGGLQLELIVEGKRMASAGASLDVLDDMEQQLGLDRQSVVKNLTQALEDLLKSQLEKVTVTNLVEDSTHPLRFRARYTYRDHDVIETGLVWYDVNSTVTGPDEVPAIVRNRMRHDVHRRLTTPGTTARALVDSHG